MAFRIGAPPPPGPPKFKKPLGETVPPDAELFEQLLPFSWRGICVPVASMRRSFSHALVPHKYWGVDAARVESTGREPIEFEVTIPFVNGIVNGKGESWGSGASETANTGLLYPTIYRQFSEAMEDKRTGVLVHPEHGAIFCKPVSCEVVHDAMTRDGVEVVAKWLETINPDLDAQSLDQQKSPIQSAVNAALDLDASRTDLLALLPPDEADDVSFEDMLDAATGLVDAVSLNIKTIASKPGQILNRVNRFVDSVQRFKGTVQPKAFTWPAIDAAIRLQDSMHQLLAPQNTRTRFINGRAVEVTDTSPRKVARFITSAQRSTPAQILSTLRALGHTVTNTDFIELNASLLGRDVVGAGTVVRYYV